MSPPMTCEKKEKKEKINKFIKIYIYIFTGIVARIVFRELDLHLIRSIF